MPNPLIQAQIDAQATPENASAIWDKAMLVPESGKRLARVALLTAIRHKDSFDAYQTAARYTDDPFEAMLISHAMYWDNDVIHAGLQALGIKNELVPRVDHLGANSAFLERVAKQLEQELGFTE
jgi:hypothetical protein